MHVLLRLVRMKNYRKQCWLRRIFPEDKRKIGVFGSVWLRWLLWHRCSGCGYFFHHLHCKFDEPPTLNSGKEKHESATTYAPKTPTPVVSTTTRGQDRQLSTVPLWLTICIVEPCQCEAVAAARNVTLSLSFVIL